MVGFVNYFKRSKQGYKLVSGALRSAHKLNPMDFINSLREVVGDNISDIMKLGADVLNNIGVGAGTLSSIIGKIPIIGKVGVFGKLAESGLKAASKGTHYLGGVGSFIAGKGFKPTNTKWYDAFIPW